MKFTTAVIAFAMGFLSLGMAQNTCLLGNAHGVCMSTDIGTCSADAPCTGNGRPCEIVDRFRAIARCT